MATAHRELAARYARVGVENVAREYPNHPGALLTGPGDLVEPHVAHPVFHGSYDWHSSVHQHWMLVRLLDRFPDLAEHDATIRWFDTHLTPPRVAGEVATFEQPSRSTFERPYGWAWLLRLKAALTHLAAERSSPQAPRAAGWADALEPLASLIRASTLRWLTATPLPHRAGAHANSAYACRLILEAAEALDDAELRAAVEAAASRWYLDDRDAPTRYEPSASDFLSPSLVEADLLAALLPTVRFSAWFDAFLTDPEPLHSPVAIIDRTDPQSVHLDGLNLSRAASWLRIAAALPAGHPQRSVAVRTAEVHRDASLPHVLDHYVGSHWLPTFAVELWEVESNQGGSLTGPGGTD